MTRLRKVWAARVVVVMGVLVATLHGATLPRTPAHSYTLNHASSNHTHPEGGQDPHPEGVAGQKVPAKGMKELLEFLQLEALDAHDPRISQPGGLKMASHTGDDLVFTRDPRGKVNVNGSPVEGLKTLDDGTKIYTLERFLEDHKDRLDEAFQFLSSHASETRPSSSLLGKASQEHAGEPSVGPVQVPRPSSVEKDDTARYSVVVSQVTEISSETSPPITAFSQLKDIIPVTESIASVPEDILPLTESLNVAYVPETQSLVEPNLVTETFDGYSPSTTTEVVLDYENFKAMPMGDFSYGLLPEEKMLYADNLETPTNREPNPEMDDSVLLLQDSTLNAHTPDGKLDFIPLEEPEQEIDDNPSREAKSLSASYDVPDGVEDSNTTEPVSAIEIAADTNPSTEISFESSAGSVSSSEISPEASVDTAVLSEAEDNLHLTTNSPSVFTVHEVEVPETNKTIPLSKVIEPERDERAFDEEDAVIEIKTQALEKHLISSDAVTAELQTVESISEIDVPEETELAESELEAPVSEADITLPVTEISLSKADITVPLTEKSLSESDITEPETKVLQPESESEPEVGVSGMAVKIGRIPPLVEEFEASTLIDLWHHALTNQDALTSPKDSADPMTILSPDYLEVVKLVVQDASHPLYGSSADNQALRSKFLLDYLVLDPVIDQDPRLAQPEGLTITNMAGKELTFKVDKQGNIVVNDIPVVDHQILPDGTQVYILSDFLFDHRAILYQSSPPLDNPDTTLTPDTWDQAQESTTRTEESSTVLLPDAPEADVESPSDSEQAESLLLVVPPMPATLESRTSSLYNLWRHTLRNQGSAVATNDSTVPGTVVSPGHGVMVTLIPQDAPNPLYDNSDRNSALRARFLLDYFVHDPIRANDPRLAQPDGLTVTNLAGKTLTFKRDADGKMTVNGISATQVEQLPDGTVVYTVDDFLFDHRALVEDAFKQLLRENLAVGIVPLPSARELEVSEPINETPAAHNVAVVPEIPQVVEEDDSLPLLNLWRHALWSQDSSLSLRDAQVPMMLLSPDFFTMMNLVPQDVAHPLYDDSDENVALRTEFLLDYLVQDPLDTHDPRTTAPEGITVTNLAGKKLTFKAHADGTVSVNGIPIETAEELTDGTQVYILTDFLFDHRARVGEAFERLNSRVNTNYFTNQFESAVEVPVTDEGVPVSEGGSPVSDERVPAFEGEAPVSVERVPAIEGEAPVSVEGVPAIEGEAPVSVERVPAIEGEAPVSVERVPAIEGEAPVSVEGVPAIEGGAPVSVERVPAIEGEAPVSVEGVPAIEGEAPVSVERVPAIEGEAPVSVERVPAIEGEAPVSVEGVPAIEGGAPVSVERVPAIEGEAPVSVEGVPAIEGGAPVSVERVPAIEGGAPVSVERVPAIEGEAPVYDEGVPAFEGEAPVSVEGVSAFEGEAPVYDEGVSAFEGEAPVYDEGVPAFEGGAPVSVEGVSAFEGEAPVYDEGVSAFEGEAPVYDEGVSAFEGEAPVYDEGVSAFEGEAPVYDEGVSAFEGEAPVYDEGVSAFEGEVPVYDEGVSAFEGEAPVYDEGVSAFEGEALVSDGGVPAFEEGSLVSVKRVPAFEGGSPVFDKGVLVSDMEIPLSKPEVLAREGNISESEAEEPLSEADVPLSEADVPLSEADVPPSEADVPLSETDVPLSEADVPLSEADVPLSEADVPLSEADVPLSEAEIPMSAPYDLVFEAELPLSEAEIKVLEERVPVVEYKVPLYEAEVALSETEVPLHEAKISDLKAEVPLSERNVSWSEAKVPLSEAEISYPEADLESEATLSEAEVPLPKINVPLSEAEVELSEINVPLSEAEDPLSEINVPLSEAEVPLSETNVLLTETNVPLSETNVPLSEREVLLSEENVPLSETNVNLSEAALQERETETLVFEEEFPLSETYEIPISIEAPVPKAHQPGFEADVSESAAKVDMSESEAPILEAEALEYIEKAPVLVEVSEHIEEAPVPVALPEREELPVLAEVSEHIKEAPVPVSLPEREEAPVLVEVSEHIEEAPVPVALPEREEAPVLVEVPEHIEEAPVPVALPEREEAPVLVEVSEHIEEAPVPVALPEREEAPVHVEVPEHIEEAPVPVALPEREEAPVLVEVSEHIEEAPVPVALPEREEAPVLVEVPEHIEEAPVPVEVPKHKEAPVLLDAPELGEEAPLHVEVTDLREEASVPVEVPDLGEEALVPEELLHHGEKAPVLVSEAQDSEAETLVSEVNESLTQANPVPEVVPETKLQVPEVDLPISEAEVSIFETNEPTFEAEVPTSETHKPTFEAKVPTSKTHEPTFEAEVPTSETQEPTFEAEVPTSETHEPTFEAEVPTSETHEPTFEAEVPTSETHEPTFEAKLPTFEIDEPSVRKEHPTSESELPTSAVDTPLISKEASVAEATLTLPSIPLLVEEANPSLLAFWDRALTFQDYSSTYKPKTILSPAHHVMVNLVPQDAPHPLYDSSPENVALLTQFVADHLVQESVSGQDPRMAQPQGLTLTNLGGHELTFKNGDDGKITVNGISVEEVVTLADGTKMLILSDFLFNHQAKVDEAFHKLLSHRRRSSQLHKRSTEFTVL
ncbi:titin homolog isoform X2 [Procambarus clarkii]|uniref:titin homolog isoform X2 n=1 Tax=Procambarus clarkii TaxID=6728 RepID=UPI0037421D48